MFLCGRFNQSAGKKVELKRSIKLPENVWPKNNSERHGTHFVEVFFLWDEDKESTEVFEKILVGSWQLWNECFESTDAFRRVFAVFWKINKIFHKSLAAKMRLLRSLSLSYQKKDWQSGFRQSFFLYDTDYRFVICKIHRFHCKVGVIPKERLVEPCPPMLLLIGQWQRRKKTHFCGTQLLSKLIQVQIHVSKLGIGFHESIPTYAYNYTLLKGIHFQLLAKHKIRSHISHFYYNVANQSWGVSLLPIGLAG